jgi:cytosine deaminase
VSNEQVIEGVALDGRVVDMVLAGGRIARIVPCAGPARWLVLPLLVDPHLHLDKTFTIGRAGRGEPGLFGAIEAMKADLANWTEADIRARARRALEEAAAAGIGGLRTHVDWWAREAPPAWGVLGELAEEWRGRIAVQLASLSPLDLLGDPDVGGAIAEAVAGSAGAVLGCFVYRNDDLQAKLARVFRLAERHGLMLDFHVDEGLEKEARGFDAIARLAGERRMGERVLCGHACSLSVRPEAEVARALDAAAEAGLALTVLPTTNAWLQDMEPGRTPRLRGLAPMAEAREAGVTVLLGADNVADPFYPFGCYDPLDVLRLAVPLAQIEPAEWVGAVTGEAARRIGIEMAAVAEGAAADFVLVEGAEWGEALRRPPLRRRVFRGGVEQGEGP